MTLTSQQRRELTKRIPWVAPIAFSRKLKCDGYRWSQMPMSAVHDQESKELYRCKNIARWRFRALRRRRDWFLTGTSGDYCFHHLLRQMYDHELEYARLREWLEEQPEMSEENDTRTTRLHLVTDSP